jgi:hypothetical protein
MGSTIFGKIETSNGTQLDAEGLKEDGKYIGHQNYEQEGEFGSGTRRNVCCIVSWIYAVKREVLTIFNMLRIWVM